VTWFERSYRSGRAASIAALICLVIFSASSSPVADIVLASIVAGMIYAVSIALYLLDDFRRGRR